MLSWDLTWRRLIPLIYFPYWGQECRSLSQEGRTFAYVVSGCPRAHILALNRTSLVLIYKLVSLIECRVAQTVDVNGGLHLSLEIVVVLVIISVVLVFLEFVSES